MDSTPRSEVPVVQGAQTYHSSDSELSNPLLSPHPVRPWGFWATLGFFAVIVVGFLGAQFAIAIGYGLAAGVLGRPEMLVGMESNGLFLALATCAASPVTIGLCVLFAWLRPGLTLESYLGFKRPPRRLMGRWLIVLLALITVSDGLTAGLGRLIVPQFMVDVYRSAVFVPLLWVAMVVAAPLTEEIFFRGFIFSGLAAGRLGPLGAILVSSLGWAVIHVQYDIYGIAIIFVSGLLLGIARWRTGSVWVAVIMHAIMNLIATIEVAVQEGFFTAR